MIAASSRSSEQMSIPWLNPQASDLAALDAILEDRDRPYYEHRLAA
jgi:hypothetical protein